MVLLLLRRGGPLLHRPDLFANPDCLLTNSNVYGVTIAEHVVMVTLMLLRRMPEYEVIAGPQLVQPAVHPLHPGQ